jgi:hypothetical protein
MTVKLKLKIIKKSIFTLLGIVLATVSVMAASFTLTDDDRAIKYEQLPAKARTFIKEHFPNEQPAYTTEDRELTHSEYKVVMASGMKIDFDNKGEWIEVDCKYTSVPEAIVPAKISDYVKKNYPASKIVEITREYNGWEVTLTGGVELTFNNSYHLTEIDD